MECNHDWKRVVKALGLYFIKCKKCGLQVEVYGDHLSVWNYGSACPYKGFMSLEGKR